MLRVTLREEQLKENERMEAQQKQDIQRLRKVFEEELQAEMTRFQREMEDKLELLKMEVRLATTLAC